MNILGISAFYHDAAAALLINGKIICAAQEERFTRIKNDASFPINAIQYCLEDQQLELHQIDAIAYYEKPFLKFERILESYYATAPRGIISFLKSMPIWIKEKIFIKQQIKTGLKQVASKKGKLPPLYFPEHHLSHAASAFFPSNFEAALILTVDGVGEYTTTSLAFGQGNKIKQLRSLVFPHSLGLLYAAATYYLGFKINSGEYKVMGLAAYGDSNSDLFHFYHKQIKEHLIQLKPDGSFNMDQKYFDYQTGLRMCKDQKWEKLFGLKRRSKEEPLEAKHQHFALAFQKVTEEILIKLVQTGIKLTGSKHLCLAGGVALNCVANSSILKQQLVEHCYVQPAAGDAGGAIGAALATQVLLAPNHQLQHPMSTIYLGPNPGEVSAKDDEHISKKVYDNFQELCEMVATHINDGKTIGWVQGRLEMGPRALGNRSILADPRSATMMNHINLLIKNREDFRPFAPVILAEDARSYFNLLGQKNSPHMLFTFPVLSNDIPAVTHIDRTARVQTVNKSQNKKLYSLLQAFKKKTGCPLLLNTSFNIKDEPMVCTAEDAYRCFGNTNLDYLVIGNTLFEKKKTAEFSQLLP